MSIDRYCGCPYCAAVFRLPDEKFKQSEGMVRCGACWEVFDANLNLMEKTAQSFELIVLGEETIEQFSSEDNADDEISDSGEGDHWFSLNNPSRHSGQNDAVSHSAGQANDANLAEASHSSDLGLSPINDEFREFDPNHIENPFVDRGHSPHGTYGNEQVYVTTEDFEKMGEPDSATLVSEPAKSTDLADDPVIQRGKLQGSGEHTRTAESAQSENRPSKVENQNATHKGDNYPTGGDRKPPNLSIDTVSQGSALDENSLGRMSRNGVDEYINDRPNPLLSIIWFFVALGFLFLLGMQTKYYFVERYAQDETYRKYLVGFCKIAKCELAPRRDPFRYTLTHTKIDLHPTQPGALRVTVKLVNEAEFAQPYPHLQLTLTDRVGRVVGRRTFSPDFYLPDGVYDMIGEGELSSIIFDLARPHEKAVGFVVDIVAIPVAS